jgi:predicted phage terminase large subunit-like protein
LYEPDRLPTAGKRAAYIDPATGEDIDKGDYTCMIIGLLSGQQVYVPHAIMHNESFERFTPSMIAALKEYHVQTLYVEANAFQTFFAKAVMEAIAKAGLKCRVLKVKQYRNKIERIDAIEPLLTSGRVLFRSDWDRRYPLLISQLGDFPNGEHDDGPDCLEGLLRALLRVKGRTGTINLPPPY